MRSFWRNAPCAGILSLGCYIQRGKRVQVFVEREWACLKERGLSFPCVFQTVPLPISLSKNRLIDNEKKTEDWWWDQRIAGVDKEFGWTPAASPGDVPSDGSSNKEDCWAYSCASIFCFIHISFFFSCLSRNILAKDHEESLLSVCWGARRRWRRTRTG
jgi:hypothetical protein